MELKANDNKSMEYLKYRWTYQEEKPMPGYLIKDTTKEERKQIVEESLGNISANCDGCMARLADMYQDYIDGKKEIREINMEFNAGYVRGDMDKEEKRSCPM